MNNASVSRPIPGTSAIWSLYLNRTSAPPAHQLRNLVIMRISSSQLHGELHILKEVPIWDLLFEDTKTTLFVPFKVIGLTDESDLATVEKVLKSNGDSLYFVRMEGLPKLSYTMKDDKWSRNLVESGERFAGPPVKNMLFVSMNIPRDSDLGDVLASIKRFGFEREYKTFLAGLGLLPHEKARGMDAGGRDCLSN